MRGKLQRGLAAVAIAVTVATALTACGTKNISKKTYMEEVDKLSVVSENFYTAMAEWAENITNGADTETTKAGVEKMRQTGTGPTELAAIENPPKAYAKLHIRLVEGLRKLVRVMDVYFDSLLSGLDGVPLSEEDAKRVQENVLDQIEEVSAILKELNEK